MISKKKTFKSIIKHLRPNGQEIFTNTTVGSYLTLSLACSRHVETKENYVSCEQLEVKYFSSSISRNSQVQKWIPFTRNISPKIPLPTRFVHLSTAHKSNRKMSITLKVIVWWTFSGKTKTKCSSKISSDGKHESGRVLGSSQRKVNSMLNSITMSCHGIRYCVFQFQFVVAL